MTPQPLPAWFVPLTWYRFGVGPRPKGAPRIVRGGQYQWVLDEWSKFEVWNGWKSTGGRKPRPEATWRTVPSSHWAWRLRADILRHVHASSGGVIVPGPQPAFKQVPSRTKGRCGLYFYTAGDAAVGAGEVARLAKKYNLWVALLAHEKDELRLDSQHCPGAIVEGCHQLDVPLVASGWVEAQFDHRAQAQAAAAAVKALGAVEYMANAESNWAWPGPGFPESDDFAPMLRGELGPNVALRLSVEWGEQIHLVPWLAAGLSVVSPQCYVNQWGHMNPAQAVDLATQPQGDLPRGIAADMVEPTYGCYGDYRMSAGAYAAAHAAARAKGARAASVWAAEFWTEADYATLAGFRAP